MTNTEKAKEFAEKYYKMYNDCTLATGIEKGAVEMAEWKDAQFKEQKELIKKSLKDEIFPYIIPSKRDKIGSIIDRIFDVNLE